MSSPASVAPPVGGRVDPEFEAVHDALVGNLTERGERGCAICVIVDRRVVADVWGGWADLACTRPWAEDTIVNAFSVGKGITSVVLAKLIERGVLDPDAPVAKWWPEFAVEGKADLTVRELAAHRAGLPALRAPQEPAIVYDWTAMTASLAAERPWWRPGAAHGYHTNTWGYLVGELIRRASGVTVQDLLAADVAGPCDADVFLGLPDAEHGRVSDFDFPSIPGREPPGEEAALMWHNAHVNPPNFSGAGVINTPEWRRAVSPSTNLHASARGVARVYAGVLGGLLSPSTIAEVTQPVSDGDDLLLGRPSRFGTGFQLTQPERPLGPNPRAFGHFGAGGSLGFCDPDAGVAFAYVINRMGERWQNPCNRALIEAVYGSL